MLRGHCHSGTALLSLRGNNGPDPPRAAMLCLRDLTNPSTFGRDRLPMPHHQAAPPALYHRTVDTGRVFPGRFKRYLLWLYYQFLHLFFSGDGAYFLLFFTEVGSNHREHTVQHIPPLLSPKHTGRRFQKPLCYTASALSKASIDGKCLFTPFGI